jgi:holo-[acyl-carrier protein] synthase
MEIGLDIVEIDRVRALVKKTPKFLDRVFSDEEIAYCRKKKLPWQHYAVRFAAKEAVWKAIDKDGLSLKDISVANDERGKPRVMIKGKPAKGFKLSLSHSDRYAVAVAVKTK